MVFFDAFTGTPKAMFTRAHLFFNLQQRQMRKQIGDNMSQLIAALKPYGEPRLDLELSTSRPRLGCGENFEANQAALNRIRHRRAASACLCYHTLVGCSGGRTR